MTLVRGYKGLFLTVAFAAAVMLLPVRADAALMINLDGYASAPLGGLTCVDNTGCDTSGFTGFINWSPAVGNWTINVQLASSNAPGGTTADLHLTSSLGASAADTLKMTVSDFFSAPLGAGTMIISSSEAGNSALTGTYTGYGVKSNASLGLFFQGSNCSYSLSGASICGPIVDAHGILPDGGYTMVLTQTVSVPGRTPGGNRFFPGNFSIDTNLSNTVPEPATLTLFGLGLFGVAEAVRRRRRQSGSKS